MRADLIQARATSIDACQEGGDSVKKYEMADTMRARAEAVQLAHENAALRETVLALHSELFGARLATKYLDKELAGRIQQLQLLGRDMRSEVRDSLWAQVEAEILLQRHKTLVRVCRGLAPLPARPPRSPCAARPRTVRVRRSPHLGLGISVTGGREHGVPILISELEGGGPAALTGELYVGDAILAINDVDLTQACHKEAVQALQSVKGDCALCVQFIATDDDDRLSEDNYRFPLYPDDERGMCDRDATPTAPRTPDDNRVDSAEETESEPDSALNPLPSYNNINNNLSILDMDDDSIRIEARLDALRLQPVESMDPSSERPGISPTLSPDLSGNAYARRRGPYRGVPDSSPDSLHSTPVHLRRSSAKKKRKPSDWRTKGSYRAVAPDAQSSDDPSLPVPPTTPPTPLELPVLPSPPDCPPTRSPPDTPTERPQLDTKHNGEKNSFRSGKGFRIGSARRVTEITKHDLPVAAGVNGEAERCKFPRLLVGDGDPDFGTPV